MYGVQIVEEISWFVYMSYVREMILCISAVVSGLQESTISMQCEIEWFLKYYHP